MSTDLREVRIVRPGVMTVDPPAPGPRIVRCAVIGVDGSEVELPITSFEYVHDAGGEGVVKLALYAHNVVFPVEGRDGFPIEGHDGFTR